MEPTLTEFRTIFTEFSEESDARVQYYMDLAIGQVGKNAFGDCYAQAVYLLTAHNLTLMSPTRASTGEKTSQKVGDISVGYKSGNMDEEGYDQTQYGIQFKTLRRAKVICPSIVDTDDVPVEVC